MADIREFYPGSDDHPVDEAGAARSLDHRAFQPDKINPGHYDVAAWIAADTPGGPVPGFNLTENTLHLPDGQTWTPSGSGITLSNADTRYVRHDAAQTINQNTARTNLGLGTAAVRDDSFFAAANHTHTASDITNFNTAVEANPDVVANTAKTGITQAQANEITANTLKVGITADQAAAITAATADQHDAVTLEGTPDYITLNGQVLTRNQINLTTDVDGLLPLTNIDVNGERGLANLIDQRASAIGSVHRFVDNAQFMSNAQFPWHVGDIIIITGTANPAEPTTYLWVGNPGNSNRNNLDDLQQITVSGGGISQGTADGRYAPISHTHAVSDINGFQDAVTANSAVAANTAKTGITSDQATAIVDNTAKVGITNAQAAAITANTAKTGITTEQASAITANTAKVTFPGFGPAATQAATGDHNHDGRYVRYDAAQTLTAPQRTQFLTNTGVFSGLSFGGNQTQSFNAQVQNIYVLDTIQESTGQTLTLPTGIEGAEVRVMNISTLDTANPSVRVPGRIWTIAPATGERIATLPANETLVLDNALASFSLTYTNANNGWIITGVE